MADPVGTAKQVVKIVLAIRTAVQTVRRNEEECREIEQLATRVSRILSRLQETESDPAMDGAMAGLEKSLDRALKLVTTCQKRSAMHRVCAAGAMARKLRRVQDDILRQLMLGVFATTTQLTLSLNMLQQPGAGAPPPRSQRPSSLGAEVRSSNFSQLERRAGLRKFSLSELQTATLHFSEENIIARGGHSTVYRGALYDRLVAVKIYNPSSRIPAERLHEHVFDELMLVSKLNHENIVNFLGYCLAIEEGKGDESSTIQESRCFMVEEYMTNGSLDRFINGSSRLHWSSVFQIIQGIAHGVKFLHDRFIVHLDLKPSNIFLGSDFNPKIADFGVARELNLRGNEYFDDNFIAGTIGYMAPEYYVGRPAHSMSIPEYYGDRLLTPSMSEGASLMKRDVYGFGATLLDILSSMCISEATRRQPSLEWAWNVQQASRMNFLKNKTRQMEKLFDPSLCENSHLKMIRRCIGIGLLCTQEKPNDRPTMREILDMLDRKNKLPTPRKPRYIK